ncbi:MAG: InlB B-repeat-containing protein [Treponema sp.]|nr:InlB B-repeat-containing protein [Treponema sp.]
MGAHKKNISLFRLLCLPLVSLSFLFFSCAIDVEGNVIKEIKKELKTTYTFFSDIPDKNEDSTESATENNQAGSENSGASGDIVSVGKAGAASGDNAGPAVNVVSARDASPTGAESTPASDPVKTFEKLLALSEKKKAYDAYTPVRAIVQENQITAEKKSFEIGKTYTSDTFPIFKMEDFDLLGWKYYKNPLKEESTVPSNFVLNSANYVVRFTATPQPAYLVADWHVSGKHEVNFVTGFENQGSQGQVAGFSVEHGATLDEFIIEYPGYDFLGWYTSTDGGKTLSEKPYDFSQPVYRKLTLYAKWSKHLYHIYYDTDGGEWKDGYQPPETFTIDDEVKLPDGNNITKKILETTYGFTGWILQGSPEGERIIDRIQKNTSTDIFLKASYLAGAVNYTILDKEQKLDESLSYAIEEYKETNITTAGTALTETQVTGDEREGFYLLPISQQLILEDGSTVVERVYVRKQITYTFDPGSGGYWDGDESDTDVRSIAGPYGARLDTSYITDPQKRGHTLMENKWDKDIPEFFGPLDVTFYANYAPNKYTVLFDTKGHGPVLGIAGKEVEFGSTVPKPEELTENETKTDDNYLFEGWFRSDDGGDTLYSERYDFSLPVEEDFTLYAKWSRLYTVTFMGRKDGLENQVLGTIQFPEGQTIDRCPYFDYTDGDYCFQYWSRDPEGNEYLDLYSEIVNSDMTVYSCWKLSVQVTLNKNDGSNWFTSYNVIVGDSCYLPNLDYEYNDSTNENSDSEFFLGWATDSSATEPEYLPGDCLENVTQDKSLYALWTNEYRTVTIINTVSDESISAKVGKGSRVQLWIIRNKREVSFTPPYDYFHMDYFTENPDSYDSNVSSGEYITVNEDLTFYGWWGKDIYFNWNSPDYSDGMSPEWGFTYIYGTQFTNPGWVPDCYGYDFTGWYTTPDCKTPVDFENRNIPDLYTAEYPKVYAGWKKHVCKVNFLVDGTAFVEEQEVEFGDCVSEPETEPSKTGSQFSYWVDEWGNPYDFTSPVENDINLSAYFEADKCTVTLVYNNGVDENRRIMVNWGDNLESYMPPETPQRTDYIFNGWHTSSDGGITLNEEPYQFTNVESSFTLYAGWVPRDYDLEFELNGGNWLSGFDYPSSYNVEELPLSLPAGTNCEKAGYAFDGWYMDSECSGQKVESLEEGSSGRQLLFAKWTESDTTYTVYHYFMDVDDENSYARNESYTSTANGVTGSLTDAAALNIEGFVAKPVNQQIILADGSTCVNIYYDRVFVTISYDANTEDSIALPSDAQKRYGQVYFVDFAVSRPNYTLIGWNTEADGSGSWYKSGETESFAAGTEDVLLYAQWQEVQGEVPSITVTLPEYSSINLSVSGTKIVVSNSSAFSSLVWYLDGENISENPVTGVTTSNMGMDINASTFKLYGVHDIYVNATEAAGGKVVTAFISLKVE